MCGAFRVTPLPRASCPVCGRHVRLRVGGELRKHRPGGYPQARDIRLCTASGLTVREATLLSIATSQERS